MPTMKNTRFLLFTIALLLLTNAVSAQKQLQSGPIVGYADMREVLLWAQTKKSAKVHFTYREMTTGAKKHKTEKVRTAATTGFTAKCIANEVEPGRTYHYDLHINGRKIKRPYETRFKTQTLWQYRTDPPAFTVAAGSCAYDSEEQYDRPGKPYGSEFFIFNSIHAKQPDLMLWLGDNTYYREPDWSTRTGMLHRFTHARSQPELQPLIAGCSQYAIWDDHDYGPNDSDRTWPHKETAWEVFRAFWGNPTYGLEGQKGITTFFKYNDIDFFLLDDRYFRTANDCESCPRTLMGEKQLAWLMEGLAASKSPFKMVIIGGQVLTTNPSHESYFNLFPAERELLLAHIARENIKGVVFVDGDPHFTELSMLTNEKGNKVYDLTCSSLTAGSFTDAATKTQNAHRVEGTLVNTHNFALLQFSGPRTARVLTVSVFDNKGNELWKKVLEP